MKINLSVYELWFWRIAIILLCILTLKNYYDNRQQDKLIFQTIDNSIVQTKQLGEVLLIQSDTIQIIENLSTKD